jgi:hypothetical protein
MKRTAVEYMIDIFLKTDIEKEIFNYEITKAKEMEKEQRNKDMMFAYEQGARLALLSQTDLARHKGVFPTPEEWIKDI